MATVEHYDVDDGFLGPAFAPPVYLAFPEILATLGIIQSADLTGGGTAAVYTIATNAGLNFIPITITYTGTDLDIAGGLPVSGTVNQIELRIGGEVALLISGIAWDFAAALSGFAELYAAEAHFIYGSPAADELTGGGEADAIYPDFGQDSINGADGDDQIILLRSYDAPTVTTDVPATINGGAGSDTIVIVQYLPHRVTMDLSQSEVRSIETFRLSGQVTVQLRWLQFGEAGVLASVYFEPTNVDSVYEGRLRVLQDAGYVVSLATMTFWDGHVNEVVGSDFDDTQIGSRQARDFLSGFAGDDTLLGLDGDDRLDGGAGSDVLIGGFGNDTYVISAPGDTIVEQAGQGTDLIETALSLALVANVENATITVAAARSLTGNTLNNVLTGNAGADTLSGGAGNDTLAGGNGNDRLLGGAGTDRMEGGAGSDTYSVDDAGDLVVEALNGGTDLVETSVGLNLAANVENGLLVGDALFLGGNALANILTGNGLGNILQGQSGRDTLLGLDGNDQLYGGNDDDRLFGGNGRDLLDGAAGSDLLDGGAGNDNLTGGAGFDTLIGGAGRDTMNGGVDANRDVFVFRSISESVVGLGRDVISGFVRGQDDIDLRAIDARTAVAGDQAFAFKGTTATAHSVWYVTSGTGIVLRGDVNGDTRADFEILLTGISAIAAGDLVL